MASAVNRFEVILPMTDGGTPDNVAINTFMGNMNTLTGNLCFFYQTNNAATGLDYINFYGYLAAAQVPTAQGYLATLRANLSSANANLLTVAWGGTTQP